MAEIKEEAPREMSFLEHLEELRWRLIKCVIAVIVGASVAYAYSDPLFKVIWYPLQLASPGIKLHFFKVAEAFATRLKLSTVAGVLASLPIVIYQIWRFVLPGLYKKELRIVYPIVFFSTIFFVIGVAFCYIYMMPWGLKFLLGQAPPDTEATLMISDYLNFFIWMVLSFGVVFQLPVVAYFLGKIGLLTSKFLSSGRRYAVIIIAIVAAVVTPQPDFISQGMLFVPLYILYELSILIVKLTGKNEPWRLKKLAG
jgi:sec-independent protein translocase protein TatC